MEKDTTERTRTFTRNVKTSDLKNLAFLSQFSDLLHITYQDMAKILGLTSAAIAYCFKVDDMKLSHVEDIFARYGYKVVISYSKPDAPVPFIDMSQVFENISTTGEQVTKRMFFFDLAFKQFGITKTEVAEKLGITRAGLVFRFNQDDCNVSMIFDVAEAFGLTPNIKVVTR